MKKLRDDFLLAFATAIFFSAFIYLAEYGIVLPFVNSLLGIGALALMLYIPKRAVLIAGFLIGLLWFYWIGYSFEYQGVGYMTPIVTFGFGVVYMLFFAPIALTNKPYIRAILLFGLSFVEPFDWNWMKIELLFVDSYFGIFKYQLAIILAALSVPSLIPEKRYKWLPLLLLVFAIQTHYEQPEKAPLNIKLVQTDILQENKWLPSELYPTMFMIFREIQHAIDEGYDVVVLPESVVPLFMNKAPKIEDKLKELSHKITIIAGTLLLEDNKNYNVTYVFENAKVQVAKKLVLVPFGEYIPLPKFAQKFINDTFFSGASDFVTAKHPTDLNIKGIRFRNAICYEATCDEIYAGDVKYVIAISNNAWFAPSIEPTLQRLLMKFYARKYGVIIYHSANYKGSGIVQ